jgi:hypothetical protein
MFFQPGVAKYEVLPPESGNAEESSFGMPVVAQQQFRHFRNRSFCVSGSVYVEHRNGLGQFCRRDLV